MDKKIGGDRHWAAIKERGSASGMLFLIRVYQVGGPALFKVCLFPVILFYYLLRREARMASRSYLDRVGRYSNSPSLSKKCRGFGHFWQFGLILIDKFSVWMGEIKRDDLVTHGSESIDRVVSSGRGAILLISHLGNFEVISALSQSHDGVKLTVLHHTQHAEKFNRVLKKFKGGGSVEFMQVADLNIATAIVLSERLERGEMIAIASDRVPINNSSATIECQFLGGRAAFPRGPYILGAILSAPLIMVTCIKQSARYHVYFDQLSEARKVPSRSREEFVADCAGRYASRLAELACLRPFQWFNFYDFWGDEVVNPPRAERAVGGVDV